MSDAHKNFAYSTVATAPSPATSGTSLVVAAADGAKFPAQPFNVTIWPAGAQPTTTNAEIARCTGVSTDTLTITRAQESSSARTVVVGDQIAATITAKTLTDVETLAAARPYRVLLRSSGTLTSAAASATKYIADQLANNTSALAVASGRGLPLLDLVAADYAVTGLTTRMLMRGQVAVGATGPAVTITIGLYPVVMTGGTYTLGTVVSGSTVAIASPGTNAIASGSSGAFTLPADGMYMVGTIVSGTPSGSFVFSGQLELQQS